MLLDFKLNSEPLTSEASGGLYDVIIIGGGAAGLTAAIYAARDKMKVLVLDRETTGGLAATTEIIENYPGFPEGINGMELIQRFRQQAERFGTEIVEFEEVQTVKPIKRGLFEIHTDAGVHQGKTVVIATGSRPKQLNVPGETEYFGRGVSYCATCDGPFFRDKDVSIIGSGNSGLQEGLHVLKYAKSVTFFGTLHTKRVEKILQDRVKTHPKSRLRFSYRVKEIRGDKTVTGILTTNSKTGEEKLFPTDGVFIYAGYSPYSDFVADLVERDERGYIHTNNQMQTQTEGLYAIGDVRANNPAQISISVGDGTKAALNIREYLLELP